MVVIAPTSVSVDRKAVWLVNISPQQSTGVHLKGSGIISAIMNDDKYAD